MQHRLEQDLMILPAQPSMGNVLKDNTCAEHLADSLHLSLCRESLHLSDLQPEAKGAAEQPSVQPESSAGATDLRDGDPGHLPFDPCPQQHEESESLGACLGDRTPEQQALLVAHLVFLMRQRWAQQTGAPALSATPLALSAARGAGVGDHTDIAEKRARTEVPDCDDFERPRQANKTQAHKTQATVARQRRAEREREAKMAGMNEPERARYLKGLRQAAATRERQRARAREALVLLRSEK